MWFCQPFRRRESFPTWRSYSQPYHKVDQGQHHNSVRLFHFRLLVPEMSKLPSSGSNTSLACRALPALAPAPPKRQKKLWLWLLPKKGKPKKLRVWLPQKRQNEKSSGSGSVIVKSKKSSGKLELWFTNLLKQFPNFINLNFVTTAKKKQKFFF